MTTVVIGASCDQCVSTTVRFVSRLGSRICLLERSSPFRLSTLCVTMMDLEGRDGDQENSTCPNVWWALALRSLSQDVSILFLRLALDAHQGRLACHPAVLMFAALFPFGLVL